MALIPNFEILLALPLNLSRKLLLRTSFYGPGSSDIANIIIKYKQMKCI